MIKTGKATIAIFGDVPAKTNKTLIGTSALLLDGTIFIEPAKASGAA